ncbi:flippase, partial [Coprococcus sp. AF21-14LB]
MYQGLILIVPLILSPCLTRTLQETAIGIYSYTNSIAYYFVILSLLGISRHGQRIISQSSENSIELRKNF